MINISLIPSDEQDVPQHWPTTEPRREVQGNAQETLTLGKRKPCSEKIGSNALTAATNHASRVNGILNRKSLFYFTRNVHY